MEGPTTRVEQTRSRRNFLRACGGLAALAAAGGAPGTAAATASRIRVGYHIFGWGRYFPDAWWAGAQASGAAGFRGIEGEYTIAELYDGREGEFDERMAACGVRLAALYSTTDLERGHEAYENERKNLHAARFCERAGARMLVVGGTHAEQKSAADFAAYNRAANELGRRILETHGVRLGAHPHLRSLVESREEIARVMDGTDPRWFFLAPDTGHLLAAGCDPLEVFETYGSRIVHAHLKDYRAPAEPGRRGAFLPLGEGDVDFPGLVRVLRESGFDGWANVELDRRGRLPEVVKGSRRYAVERLGIDPSAAPEGPPRPGGTR
jgi:inosose dehydratase